MKKTIMVIIAILTFGCKSYVQVFDTKSTNTKLENEFYVFENDSLKIKYSFWSEKGILIFSIFNKLNTPLYIDWKKSSYIDNSVKLDYWIDEEKKKILEYYGSYFYNGPFLKPGFKIISKNTGTVSSTGNIERITFIPPKSNYYRSQFYIFPVSFFKLDINSKPEEFPIKDNPEKKTKVYEKSYSKENSPLVFRNFLTFSTSENFDTEFYVDNEFYISKISEMDARNFEYSKYDQNSKTYVRDEYGKVRMFTDFKKETSFYIYIPREGKIGYRKKYKHIIDEK